MYFCTDMCVQLWLLYFHCCIIFYYMRTHTNTYTQRDTDPHIVSILKAQRFRQCYDLNENCGSLEWTLRFKSLLPKSASWLAIHCKPLPHGPASDPYLQRWTACPQSISPDKPFLTDISWCQVPGHRDEKSTEHQCALHLWSVSHRLIGYKQLVLVAGDAWEGYGTFRIWSFARENGSLKGESWGFIPLPHFLLTFFFLCVDTKWAADSLLRSYFFPISMDWLGVFKPKVKVNLFFLKLLFVRYLVTAMRKVAKAGGLMLHNKQCITSVGLFINYTKIIVKGSGSGCCVCSDDLMLIACFQFGFSFTLVYDAPH